MDDINTDKNKKKIKPSSSSMNIKSNKVPSNFVFLVNKLSSNIKQFYQSIKPLINQGKKISNNKKIVSNQIYDSIDQNLTEFITKAKDIFKRMKYIQKINLIQQELNNNKDLNPSNNSNINDERNDEYDIEKNIKEIKDRKKIMDEEVNIPSLFDNNSISFNFKKINNKNRIKYDFDINKEHFKKMQINNKNERNEQIKSLHNFSRDIKLINKYDNIINFSGNQKNHLSAGKIIYNNCNRQYNNLKRNHNIKSVINLRKKFRLYNKLENSNSYKGINNIETKINSFNNSQNNTISKTSKSKRDIFDNLNIILSLLKELKLIKGNIL